MIKNCNAILSLVKNWSDLYLKKKHKFGVRLPKSLQEAYKLDKETNSQMWTNTIDKEMKDVRVAFLDLDDGEPIPIGNKLVRRHLIFDVKMEDFRRKARSRIAMQFSLL